MAALNQTVENYEISLRRSLNRFRISKSNLIKIKVNGREVPSVWIHDISQSGMQLRLSRRAQYVSNQIVRINLILHGGAQVELRGIVRWKQEKKQYINMVVVGIEFIRPRENKDYGTLWGNSIFQNLLSNKKCDALMEFKDSEKFKIIDRLGHVTKFVWVYVLAFALGYFVTV